MRRIPYRAFFCASFLLTQTAISHSEQSLDRYLYRLNKDAAHPNQFQIKTPYPQSQFSLPDYSLRMNPAGITYGGTASLNKGKESFLIPGLSGLQPNQIRGQHLGEGKIEVGGNKFSYSDLYTVIPWKDSQQIFTLAFGTAKGAENGGLFIGVGNSYDRSQTNREIENSLQSSKIGFLLPTGTGILLSPTSLPRQPHQTNFQSLHASWFNGSGSQSVPMTDKSKSANFLLSPALQIERNPLQNYFPKQVENIVQGKTHHPLAQEGEVSPQSLVRFFERTDPVSRSGPTQISYADPMNRRLEYMTSQGFHYKIAPYFGSRIEENIVVKQFGAGMGTDWTLLSSIQNRNSPQEQKILRLFSRQNQGTAQIYIAAGPLDLDSALQNGWMGKAKLLFQEENIWTRYSHAIQLGKQGLRKTSDALSRFAAGLQSNNVRPIYPNSSLDTNLQPAKPFLKQSQRILENLSRGLEIAQKTEFISPKEFEIFELRKRGVESSHAASKTLSQKLLIQNEILSQIQKEPSNFGLLSVQREKFRELSDWIGNDLSQLHRTAQIFGVHDPGQAFFLYKARSEQLQKENFQESNLEYAKSKAYLDLAKNSLNPGIQIHAGGSMISSFFKGLALEGKEESSLWKRALGETGQFASWILPFSGLGERMVLAYDQPQYPSQSDLLTVGALQTVTDGLKILNLGGIQKGVKSFSQESLRISLKSLRSQSLPLGGLGLASGVQGVTDNLCEDCPFLQKTIGLTAFVGGLGSLHIGKKIAEKMRLEGEFLSPNLKRAWKLSKPVLFQESLPAFSRETATYLTLIGSEKAVASLPGLFYLRDHPFLTGQTQLTLEPALPFLAGRVGSEISGFTFKKRSLLPSQNSFFDSPRTERQRESVSSLRSLLGKQEFHAAEIEQLKAGMIQFLEEAGNIQKRTGETSETNSPFRLKRSQVSGLENSIQALLSKESPSLPIHVHLLPTGSGKTTLAMGQILAARLRDIPLQKRTHVQSNTESNLAQLYQTARDLYGSSLGKMGFIPETSSETMAKKIAQESDILFLTTGKQGELHALEKERGQNRKRWEKNNSFILDMNRRTGVKIVDEIDALLYSPAHQIDGGSEKIRWDSPSGQFWRFVGQTAEMIAEKRRPLAELEKLERGAVKRIWKKSQGLGFAYSQTETGRILKNSVQALEDRKGEDYAIVHGEIKLIQSGVAKNLVKEAGYLQALEHKYGLRKLTPPRPLNEKRFAQTDLDALKAGHGPVLGNSATLTPSAQEVLRAAFRLDSQPPPIFVTGEPSPQVPNFEMRTRKNLKELYRKAASLTRDPKDQVFLGSFSAEQARIFRNVLVKSGLANVRDIFLAGSVTPGERIFQAVRSGRYRITLGNADQIGRGLDLKQVLGTERLKVIGFNTAVSPESTLIQLFGRALGERSKRWRKQPKFYLLSDQETLDRTVPKPIREQVRRSGGWDSRKLKELLPKIQTLSEKKALEPSRSNISSKSGTRQKNRHFLSNTKPLFINFFANKNWMKNMFPIRSYAQRDGNLFLGGARPRGLARRRSRQNASAEISDAPKKRFPSRFVMPEGGTFPIKRLKYYLAQIAENYSKHNPLLFKLSTHEIIMKIKEKLLSVAKVKKTPLMLSLSKHERSAFGNSRPSTSSGRAVSIALLMQHSIKANNPTNFKKTVVKQVIQQSPKQQTKNQGWKPFEWRHHIPKFWKNVSSYHKISNKEGSGNFTAGMLTPQPQRSGMENFFAGALAPAGSLDGDLGRKKVPSSPTPREKVFHPASLGQRGVRPWENGLNYFQTLKRYLNSKDAEKVFKRQH